MGCNCTFPNKSQNFENLTKIEFLFKKALMNFSNIDFYAYETSNHKNEI